MADVHRLLRPLERLETAIEEIYQAMASSHADDAEASKLFARLAMEERSHASHVAYVRRLATQNAEEFSGITIDLSEVLKTLDDVATLRSNLEIVPLAEALSTLCTIEQAAGEAHARNELAGASPSLSGLMTSLLQGDQSHTHALREFATRRGLGSS